MNVCGVLTAHMVPCIEAGTIAQLFAFIPFFFCCGMRVVLGTEAVVYTSVCLVPSGLALQGYKVVCFFFFNAQFCDSLWLFPHVSMLLCDFSIRVLIAGSAGQSLFVWLDICFHCRPPPISPHRVIRLFFSNN